MAVFCVLISSLAAYAEFMDVRLINKPRLILSVQGIMDSEGTFYSWLAVSGEKITAVGNSKPNYFLSFSAAGKSRKLHLSGLNKSPAQVMELVKHYRESYIRIDGGDV
jgi:hypothetical protein